MNLNNDSIKKIFLKMEPDDFIESVASLIDSMITDKFGPDSSFILVVGDTIDKCTRTCSNISRDDMVKTFKMLSETSEELKNQDPENWETANRVNNKESK